MRMLGHGADQDRGWGDLLEDEGTEDGQEIVIEPKQKCDKSGPLGGRGELPAEYGK